MTTLQTQPDQSEKETVQAIDRLVHEILNNLQVIRMEAGLVLMDRRSKRKPKCAIDAAQSIEKLLAEVRHYFLLPR
jgi:hypothetical protein